MTNERRKPMWKIGDIVQIDPESDEVFGGCLMTVTEPKIWGAQGFFEIPGEGRAFYRVKYENAVRVGFVEWIWENKEEE